MAAFAKVALSLLPKDKAFQWCMYAVVGFMSFGLLVIIFVGALFDNVPLGRSSADYDLYRDVAEEINEKTKLNINYMEVMAIDAVLLKQDFSQTSRSRVELMTNMFIRSQTVEEERDCLNEDGTISKGEEKCTVNVTYYYQNSFDDVLNKLVRNGTLQVEEVPIVKNYTQIDFSMLASGKDIELGEGWSPQQGDYGWPVPDYTRISSHFGVRIHPITGKEKNHNGMDIAAPIGAEVLAIADGVVTKAGNMGTAGKTVIIDHGNNTESRYYHLSYIGVTKGQKVRRGDYIADVGNTGSSTGPHLHLEIRINKVPVNPYQYYKN